MITYKMLLLCKASNHMGNMEGLVTISYIDKESWEKQESPIASSYMHSFLLKLCQIYIYLDQSGPNIEVKEIDLHLNHTPQKFHKNHLLT